MNGKYLKIHIELCEMCAVNVVYVDCQLTISDMWECMYVLCTCVRVESRSVHIHFSFDFINLISIQHRRTERRRFCSLHLLFVYRHCWSTYEAMCIQYDVYAISEASPASHTNTL